MKKEGDRKICQECKSKGINIEIVCKKITFKGEERLSYRNPDGSAHFDIELDDNGQPKLDKKGYVILTHTPTIKTELDIWKEEMEDRMRRVEKEVGIICLD